MSGGCSTRLRPDGRRRWRRLQTALHEKSLAPTVRALIKRELLEERYGLSRPAVRAKTEEWLHLAVGVDAAQMAINRWPQSRRSRQADLLERLQAGPAPMVEARKLASGAPALNRWRAESGLIAQADEQVRLGAEPAAVDSAIASLRRSAAERHQVALLETLLTGPHREPDVRVEVNATRTDIEALIEAGLVKRETRRITRNLLVDRTASAADPRVAGAPVVAAAARPALTAYQARAYRAIAEALDSARETQRTGPEPASSLLLTSRCYRQR